MRFMQPILGTWTLLCFPPLSKHSLNRYLNQNLKVCYSLVKLYFYFLILGLLLGDTVSTKDADGEGGRRLTESTDSTLSLITYNSYTRAKAESGTTTSNEEYPWRYMVEPYRASTLQLQNTVSGATYRWTVDGHIHGFGTSIEALFTDIGYHMVKIEEMIVEDDGSTTTNKLAVKVMCKYVRREIRSISDLDREAWLSAIQVIQHVPTIVGKSIYGSKYMSKDDFTRVHLYYGGALDCDHWHQVISPLALPSFLFHTCSFSGRWFCDESCSFDTSVRTSSPVH